MIFNLLETSLGHVHLLSVESAVLGEAHVQSYFDDWSDGQLVDQQC